MTELLRRDQAISTKDNAAATPLAPAAPALPPTKIDKSKLAIADPSAYVIRLIKNSSLRNHVSCAGGNPPIRITSALRSRAQLVSKTVMSSLYHSAACIIGNCTRTVMKGRGGKIYGLTPLKLQVTFGRKRIPQV